MSVYVTLTIGLGVINYSSHHTKIMRSTYHKDCYFSFLLGHKSVQIDRMFLCDVIPSTQSLRVIKENVEEFRNINMFKHSLLIPSFT